MFISGVLKRQKYLPQAKSEYSMELCAHKTRPVSVPPSAWAQTKEQISRLCILMMCETYGKSKNILFTIAPGYRDALKEYEEQETHSTGRVVVKKLEHIDSTLKHTRRKR